MKPSVTVFLALGTNIGSQSEQLGQLRGALRALEAHEQIRLTGKSSVYQSQPWGVTDQPEFLNAVVRVQTSLAPLELLRYVKECELSLGRKKTIRWGPRQIDIDLALYDKQRVELPELTIPHRYLLERAFVVVPLLEIEPEAQLPGGQLLREAVELEQMQKELVKVEPL